MKPWNELSRDGKIKSLFNYPESMHERYVKELWGPEASVCYGHISFPPDAPWSEIVEVLKSSHSHHTTYVHLNSEDFKMPGPEELNTEYEKLKDKPIHYRLELYEDYQAFFFWRAKMLRSPGPKKLDLALYDDSSLICRVCTREGYRGDDDGFGVEPDSWASALFDLDGNVIRPFAPGYIS